MEFTRRALFAFFAAAPIVVAKRSTKQLPKAIIDLVGKEKYVFETRRLGAIKEQILPHPECDFTPAEIAGKNLSTGIIDLSIGPNGPVVLRLTANEAFAMEAPRDLWAKAHGSGPCDFMYFICEDHPTSTTPR